MPDEPYGYFAQFAPIGKRFTLLGDPDWEQIGRIKGMLDRCDRWLREMGC